MRTTTNNLMSIISSKTARVDNVILRYSSNEPEKEELDSSKFIESLEYLNESGIFADAVDWKFDVVHSSNEKDKIIVHGGRMTSHMICSVDFDLLPCGDMGIKEVETKLKETVFSKLSA